MQPAWPLGWFQSAGGGSQWWVLFPLAPWACPGVNFLSCVNCRDTTALLALSRHHKCYAAYYMEGVWHSCSILSTSAVVQNKETITLGLTEPEGTSTETINVHVMTNFIHKLLDKVVTVSSNITHILLLQCEIEQAQMTLCGHECGRGKKALKATLLRHMLGGKWPWPIICLRTLRSSPCLAHLKQDVSVLDWVHATAWIQPPHQIDLLLLSSQALQPWGCSGNM